METRKPVAVLDEDPPTAHHIATCPLCDTRGSTLTTRAVEGGDGWECTRCGQRWTATRVAAVAAYAAWAFERDRQGSR